MGKFEVTELIQKEIVKNAKEIRKNLQSYTRLNYINEGLQKALTIIENLGSKERKYK